MGFNQPVDIANRALQHCGASRIVTLLDNDKGAAEISQCYDQLREAELRRNVWRFSTKRAVLYPINTGVTGLTSPTASPTAPATVTSSLPTMQLLPLQEWSATEDYNQGAISVDAFGQLWQSTIPHNINQQPGQPLVQSWEIYFGSLCVAPYDSTVTYYAGDHVYVTNLLGVTAVYTSLENSNASTPTTGSAWSGTETYAQGTVVEDAAGFFWQSLINLNTNMLPGVYGMWRSGAPYPAGSYVIGSDRVLYQALILNTGNNPANGAHPVDWLAIGQPGSYPIWNINTAYMTGDFIAGSDGQVYQAVQGNTGHNPVGSTYNPLTPSTNYWLPALVPCPWNPCFSATTGSGSWMRQPDLGVQPINIIYPIGSGPSTQVQTRNVYMLPNGFLREAPQDPKAGSNSFLGAPSGLQYDDWEFEGNFMVTREVRPIVFRFVANTTQVSSMDPMFCEGLAARIAKEVCETLTQSTGKLASITAAYNTVIGDARTVNGIETGPTEPPEDDYISCRF